MMRCWQTWISFLALILLCGYGTLVLLPIFASAKAATAMSDKLRVSPRFRIAVTEYAQRHKERLPAKDWKNAILEIDPSLASVLRRKEDELSYWLAAVPGVLGQRLETMPLETVVFVGYRSDEEIDILRRFDDIGDAHHLGSAVSLTTEQIFNGGESPPDQHMARIGFHLASQGARLE